MQATGFMVRSGVVITATIHKITYRDCRASPCTAQVDHAAFCPAIEFLPFLTRVQLAFRNTSRLSFSGLASTLTPLPTSRCAEPF